MKLIDAHGHLNLAPLVDDWQAVLSRCLERGVDRIIVPGTNLESSRMAVSLAKERPLDLAAAVGVHPTEIHGVLDPEIRREILALASDRSVVAIGEVGLDTYRVPIPNDEFLMTNDVEAVLATQEGALREFIQLAIEVRKPLIIHCRGGRTGVPETALIDPYERLIELLGVISNRPSFVIHCYQGSLFQAERFIELGGYISFTGTVTYSKDPAVRELLSALPIDRIFVETDSPYLSPVPYRGEVNEPWKVIEVARRIADIKGISLSEVAQATTNNAERFFELSS